MQSTAVKTSHTPNQRHDIGRYALGYRLEAPTPEPEFRIGDYVFYDREAEIEPGDFVLVRRFGTGEKTVVKASTPDRTTIARSHRVTIFGRVIQRSRPF